MFMKIWVQHDQGGGDRTCLQILRLDPPRSPGPLGHRRTRRRSNLRANDERYKLLGQTRSNKSDNQTRFDHKLLFN